MTSIPASGVAAHDAAAALSRGRVAVLLTVTVLVALFMYYLIGVEQGTVALFGDNMVVHEWVHDARHLLGFPCH